MHWLAADLNILLELVAHADVSIDHGSQHGTTSLVMATVLGLLLGLYIAAVPRVVNQAGSAL
jgi:hypothetical protein